MTEQTTTTDQGPEPTEHDEPSPDRKGRDGAEAAKYRRQLREVEAERDALAASLTVLRAQAAEAAIGSVLDKPASLWLTGAKADDFYSEDGSLQVGRLHEAATRARDEHGLTGTQVTVLFSPSAIERDRPADYSTSWSEALRR